MTWWQTCISFVRNNSRWLSFFTRSWNANHCLPEIGFCSQCCGLSSIDPTMAAPALTRSQLTGSLMLIAMKKRTRWCMIAFKKSRKPTWQICLCSRCCPVSQAWIQQSQLPLWPQFLSQAHPLVLMSPLSRHPTHTCEQLQSDYEIERIQVQSWSPGIAVQYVSQQDEQKLFAKNLTCDRQKFTTCSHMPDSAFPSTEASCINRSEHYIPNKSQNDCRCLKDT